MDKAPDAYRTISEVADDLDLPQHVLRFWETRFAQIRPLKRGGGRRYYRPEDIDLLKGIRHLLYGEGYTIRGVQRIIKESGIKSVQALGRGEGGASLPKPKGPDIIGPEIVGPDDASQAEADDVLETSAEPANGGLRAGLRNLFRGGPPEGHSPSLALEADAAEPPLGHDSYGERPFAAMRREPVVERPERDEMRAEAPAVEARPSGPRQVAHVAAVAEQPQPVPPRNPQAGGASAQPVTATQHPTARQLSTDDVRKLQAAIYELTECRKRLDQAMAVR